MNRYVQILGLAVLAGCAGGPAGGPERAAPAADRDRVAEAQREAERLRRVGIIDFSPPRATFEGLHELLSGFGYWIDVPVYGEVWKPNPELVGEGWVPYSRGRWVYTKCGWTWISAFDEWGWAAFHFGRFALTPTAGWVWTPGVTWSPAHVAWREGESLVGWAAVPPGYSVAEDVYYGSTARVPREAWVFAEKRDFLAPDVSEHLLSGRRQLQLLVDTHRIRRWRELLGQCVYVGPHPQALLELTGQEIPVLTFAAIKAQFGGHALPEGFVPDDDAELREFSEVRPDVDRVVTVVGPNSPKKLPPRKVPRYYDFEAPPDESPPQEKEGPAPPRPPRQAERPAEKSE